MLETELELDLSGAREQLSALGEELDNLLSESRELDLELDVTDALQALADVESVLDNLDAETVQIDADASGLESEVESAQEQLSLLDENLDPIEIDADASGLEAVLEDASGQLALFDGQEFEATLTADVDDVVSGAEEAEAALDGIGGSATAAGGAIEAGFANSGRVVDALARQVGQLDSRLGTLVSTAGGVGPAFGAAAAAGGALAFLGDQVERAQQEIILGTGAAGDRLSELTAIATELVGTIPGISFQQAGEDIAQLDTLLDATNEQLRTLGIGLGLAGADATQFARLVNSLGLDVADGVVLLEQLFQASQDYGISVNDQVNNLQRYGQILATANVSQEEQVLLFSQLFAAGADVERVQSGLARVLGEVTAEGGDAAAVLRDIFDTTDQITFEELQDLGFDSRSITSILQAVQSGVVDLNAELDITGESLVETAERARPSVDELALAFRELVAEAAPLGTLVLNGLLEIIDAVQFLLTPFVRLGEVIGEVLFLAFQLGQQIGELLVPVRDFVVGVVEEIEGAINSVGDFVGSLVDEADRLTDLNPFDGSFLGFGEPEARFLGKGLGEAVGREFAKGVGTGFDQENVDLSGLGEVLAVDVDPFAIPLAELIALDTQRDIETAEAEARIQALGESLAAALDGAAPDIQDAVDALFPDPDTVDVDAFFDALEEQVAARTNFGANVATLLATGQLDENSLDFLLGFGDQAAQTLAQSFVDGLREGDLDPVAEFNDLFAQSQQADTFLDSVGQLGADSSVRFADGFQIDLAATLQAQEQQAALDAELERLQAELPPISPEVDVSGILEAQSLLGIGPDDDEGELTTNVLVEVDDEQLQELDADAEVQRIANILSEVERSEFDALLAAVNVPYATDVAANVDAAEFDALVQEINGGSEFDVTVQTVLDGNTRAILDFLANGGNVRSLLVGVPGFDAGGVFDAPQVIAVAERGRPEAVVGGHHDPHLTARRLDEVGALQGIRTVEAERIAAEAMTMMQRLESPAMTILQPEGSTLDTSGLEREMRRQGRVLQTIAGASMDQVEEMRAGRRGTRRPLSELGGWK